jgi:hypothetical protein
MISDWANYSDLGFILEIDGIVALLQGLSGILPPQAIEALIHETKNNDLHEAAASLTNLFAVTSQ